MPGRFWIAIGAIGAVVLVVQLPGTHATAWHFFELAADLLVDSGPEGDRSGLRLYGDHPELQFGPTSILIATPFTLIGGAAGELLAMLFMSMVGVAVAWMILDVLRDTGTLPALAPSVSDWVVAIAVVITWGDIAVRTAHIDDAIAVAAMVAGLRQVQRDRPGTATLLFALAAAAKPWAVVFVPLCALPWRPGSWRRPVLAAAIAVGTWVPFIIAEPDTLDTSEFGIANDPTSSLRAFGIDAATTPGWVRPAQLVGGLAIVSFLVLRSRWPAAILAGISWRLLLDPGVHRYYTVGFVVGAALVEHRIRPGRPPWFTVAGAVVLEVTAIPDGPVLLGQATRLGVLVIALAAAFGHPSLEAPPRNPGAAGVSMFEDAYATTVRLIGRIPRLDPVADIITEAQHPAGIADAATVVRAVTEFDFRCSLGQGAAKAIKELEGCYPTEILDALESWDGANDDAVQKLVTVHEVIPGMVAEKDIITSTGNVLVRAGTDITETVIQRLHNFARSQGIEEPITVALRAA